MSDVNPEAVACRMLREYLLAEVPTRLATINGNRYAQVKSTTPGSWDIFAGAALTLGDSRTGAGVQVTLPDGSGITVNQVALAINLAGAGVFAGADAAGRLVVTSGTGVLGGDGTSACVVHPDSGNSIFGWLAEGVHDVRGVIAPPTWRSVMDGWPVAVPDAKTMAIIIGDRETTPLGGFRRDEYLVTARVEVWNVDGAVSGHRTRESIQACVQCVREVLESDEGRRLGDASGIIQHVSVGRVLVKGVPYAAYDEQRRLLGPPSDVARMDVQMKVFMRPDAAP